MIEISAEQVTPAVRAFFQQDEPQARRCFAVLDGVSTYGSIFTDDVSNPTWAIVQEYHDYTLFLGGYLSANQITASITSLRKKNPVLIGLWPDDPRWAILPPNPEFEGTVLEFYQRPRGKGVQKFLDNIPNDCKLRRLDKDLILRTEWGPADVRAMGGLENWDKACFGYCLLQGDVIVADATVGPPAIGLYELGVFTHATHRGKGYGTIVSAKLIQEIEALGGESYWNCAKQNVSSAAIARKLGYQIEKEYKFLYWDKLP